MHGFCCCHYTDESPPRRQSLVVVCFERVGDDGGIWGTLPEWGFMAVAYLPPGKITAKRKDQAKFLSTARRTARTAFVVEVVDVDELPTWTSSAATGVCFHITLDRRGVRQEEEKTVIDRWCQADRAARLVDAAGKQAGVPRVQARRAVMYATYSYRLAGGLPCSVNTEQDEDDPKAAAIQLLAYIGHCDSKPEVDLKFMNLDPALFEAIVKLCREQREHPVCSRPCSEVVDMQSPLHGVQAVRAAISMADTMLPPEDCAPLTVTIAGPGSYAFATSCTDDEYAVAIDFVRSAIQCARHHLDTYTDSATDSQALLNSSCTDCNDKIRSSLLSTLV